MTKIYLSLILFFFLVVEGVAIDLLPNSLVLSDYYIIAHWILAVLVYIAIYYDISNTYYSVLYAFIFGLLIDIVYTELLGVYMFSYGIVIYIIHELQKMLQRNLFVLSLLGVIAITLADLLIYIMYSVAGITEMIWKDYFGIRLIPTVFANLLFLYILYPFLKERAARWGDQQVRKRN